MANTTIQLKWSDVTSAPTTLNVGEPAYSNTSHKFFIGDTAGNVLTIGGKYFTDQQGLIFTKTNVAFDTANSAASYANSAFATANAGTSAASAASYANGAFIAANSAASYANSGFAVANSAASYANAAFLTANTPSYTANSASSYANSAFGRANNSINANTGGTITADLVVTGNLTVQGNTTFVNSQTITTGDSLIRLANNNIVGDTVDIGLYGAYNPGSGVKYTGLVRQAGANYFLFQGLDTDPTSNVLAAGSLTAANTGTLTANLTSYAISINGVDVETNQARIFTQANSSFGAANSAASYANSSFAVANSASSYANAAFAVANNNTGINVTQNTNITAAASYANAAFAQANTDFTNISTTAADHGTASSVSAFRLEANGRISSANSTAIAIDTAAITSGTLGVTRGGSGAGTFTNNGVLLGQGTSAFTTASSSTEGHVLTINASGVPTFSHLQGGTF
jgi:hypothetical protein